MYVIYFAISVYEGVKQGLVVVREIDRVWVLRAHKPIVAVSRYLILNDRRVFTEHSCL